MPGESAKPNPLKGEYSNNGECVDLYVKKGCVNYSVCVAGDKTCDKAPVVKVCSDAKSSKPTNICKKGAKRIHSGTIPLELIKCHNQAKAKKPASVG